MKERIKQIINQKEGRFERIIAVAIVIFFICFFIFNKPTFGKIIGDILILYVFYLVIKWARKK